MIIGGRVIRREYIRTVKRLIVDGYYYECTHMIMNAQVFIIFDSVVDILFSSNVNYRLYLLLLSKVHILIDLYVIIVIFWFVLMLSFH
jgi:hypothetical protein